MSASASETRKAGFRQRRIAGFTLVELLVVLFIMVLLTVLAVPLFSQLVKVSRVDKAVNAVFAAVWEARSQAQNYMKPVGVFLGEDPAKLNPAPLPGVVPPKGQIQTWTCEYGTTDAYTTQAPKCPEFTGWPPHWYPYRFLSRPLSGQPITYPDGVRISAGEYQLSGSQRRWSCPEYRKDSIGEIKRHHIVFRRDGATQGWGGGTRGTYLHVLVWDEAAGVHAVIQAGEWRGSTRPRVVCRALTHVNGTALADYRNLGAAVDGIPGNK